ncbi:chaperone required for assembly of F1-ATPase [Bradyrhizobium sp. LB13.1]
MIGTENEMRELFDEAAGRPPLDPQESVRQAARAPQRKRFYKDAGVADAEGGFAITLDGKPIRTPSGRQVVIPSRARWPMRSPQNGRLRARRSVP